MISTPTCHPSTYRPIRKVEENGVLSGHIPPRQSGGGGGDGQKW